MTAQQHYFSDASDSDSYSKPIEFKLITAPSALTAILAAAIQAQVSANDALPPAPFEDMTVFHALEAPAISVVDYVARVSKYVFCSEACLVAAYHYVNTAVRKDPKLALTSLSIHRMFITAIVLACKYHDDLSYNLSYYSKVGGLPPKELAHLELSMLRILDFRLDISAVDFVAIEEQLVSELQYLQVHPMNQTVADLAGKAAVELANAHIDPIPLEPLQGCDEQEDTIELFCKSSEQRRPSKPGIELQTSPATSACTDEGSKLSRNSSMNSVVEDSELHSSCKSAKKSPCRKDAQREHITHSPTTPGDDYRQCRTVSTVC